MFLLLEYRVCMFKNNNNKIKGSDKHTYSWFKLINGDYLQWFNKFSFFIRLYINNWEYPNKQEKKTCLKCPKYCFMSNNLTFRWRWLYVVLCKTFWIFYGNLYFKLINYITRNYNDSCGDNLLVMSSIWKSYKPKFD